MSSITSRRVLVADDEELVSKVLSQLIKKAFGCEVVVAEDGDSALRLLEEQSFDVAILDMVMPGLHGLELIQTVHMDWPEVVIIAATGLPDEFSYVDVVRAGATDFVAKPQQPGELEAKLLHTFRELDLHEAQELAEQKYRSLFEFNMSGMLFLAPETYEVLDANRAFCDIVGRTRGEMKGQAFLDLFNQQEKWRLEQALGYFVDQGQGTLADVVFEHADGRKRCLDLSITFITAGGEQLVFASFKDVTEQREMQRQLEEVAATDDLTGLYNQRTLHSRLERAVNRARKSCSPLTLLFMDLDDFKQCNDRYGHPIGDKVLKQVGKLIKEHTRDDRDEGFRYGGDEFAIILNGASAEIAQHVAERIREEFEASECYDTSLSVGIAQYDMNMEPEAFVKTADEALYKAKSAGKNITHVA
jgi:diguanylate cyclase (GGDEF)-like protein/PAS domain S-box-containing protein